MAVWWIFEASGLSANRTLGRATLWILWVSTLTGWTWWCFGLQIAVSTQILWPVVLEIYEYSPPPSIVTWGKPLEKDWWNHYSMYLSKVCRGLSLGTLPPLQSACTENWKLTEIQEQREDSRLLTGTNILISRLSSLAFLVDLSIVTVGCWLSRPWGFQHAINQLCSSLRVQPPRLLSRSAICFGNRNPLAPGD